ncbi:hypothetical protein CONLIGDRAFT_33581 [Coniochaeta ligniaria NRRL 30616]|uniref:Uncharacterized protein n=1 Tax=Coniochaeta ligniaria NRRL 30616 TaxID=1408157 RepID=A0A1J7K470_9PEZI|nr:hypothetical protein CONLIGDRAFT_33581 [Coniochaeta ligniaria NRRL 30616]
MPRFSVAFGRRKSTADNLDNDVTAEPSFRVLDRSEVAPGKSFDGGASFAAKTHTYANHSVSDIKVEDNLFADLKPQTNRGSGSSNTTKTISTDTSSRHSNVSTAASSADLSNHNEDQKIQHRKPTGDGPGNHGPKHSSGFLKAAGRSFSFGGQKKPLPVVPNLDEPLPPPPVPPHSEDFGGVGRARAATASTSATVTPPKLESDFSLDLGGDFGKMFGFDKRASVMTIRGNEPNGRQALGPRSLTGNRLNQPGPIPAPIQINKTAKIDASPHSWGSQHSNEGLLTHSPAQGSPTNENAPPAVPRQPSPLSGRPLRPGTSPETRKLSGFFGKRALPTEPTEDEDAKLLKDSLSTVSKFMSGSSAANVVSKPKSGSRYRRDEDTLAKSEAKTTDVELEDIGDDNLFDNSLAHSSRLANRFVAQKPSPPRTKVMTPAQFERYRQDKERQSTAPDAEKTEDKSDDEEIDYDDDEDDIERAKQQAKQRRKQEAHMAVYRQQMMKVTGESSGSAPSRPSLQMSFSTPNLPNMVDSSPAGKSDSDEDEEVPLAILAAHGFPNKARPPTRLSTMMSNPNLRASAQPSYQRPGSVAGDAPGGGSGRLPAFARKLPQDPFLGAGLVHNPIRESIAFSGGAPARGHPGPVPPGGLVGVIVNEERSRAMRRGSPHLDPHQPAGYDAVGGIPPHMLYQNNRASTMMTPGDQAQMQMTQQMQQFMQMQMQFMQMMTGQNGNAGMGPNGMPNGMSPAAMNSMMAMGGMGGPDMRHSYMGNGSVVDLPRPESHSRSMSMVQPSSASWIQPPPQINPGFAPSIHIQGVGYAPSIAPSERSNVGLPGRYRPVSHMPAAAGQEIPRSSTMSGALAGWDKQPSPTVSVTPVPAGRKSGSGNASEDDDEEGWQAMKEKREKKRSIWKSKKSFGADIGALIN